MHRSLPVACIVSVLISGCTVAQSTTSAVLAEVKRTTKKEDVLCTLSMDHADMVPVSTTKIAFEVLSPAEFSGRQIALTLFEKPAQPDSFADVLSQDRFLLRLRREDFTHPEPLDFRSIVLRFGPSEEEANQQLEPTRGEAPRGSP